MYNVKKSATLTCPNRSMYLQLDNYPPYYDKKLDVFETHNNRNLRCIHGCTDYIAHNDFITWVSKNSWKMLFSELSQAEK